MAAAGPPAVDSHFPLSELPPIALRLGQLAHFIHTRSNLSAAEATIYADAIAELEACFAAAGAAGARTDITEAFTWIYRVAGEFMPLLREGRREAIAVFAYWVVLIKRVDGHWWMQGWPEHLIAKAYYLLGDEAEAEVYRLCILWPMEEIGWSPPP